MRRKLTSLGKLDRKLKNIDFNLKIEINHVSVYGTGNKNQAKISNRRILQVGLENQKISVEKKDYCLSLNILGIKLTTFYQMSVVYLFFQNFLQSNKVHMNNFMLQTSDHQYKKFLSSITTVRDIPRASTSPPKNGSTKAPNSHGKITFTGAPIIQGGSKRDQLIGNSVNFNQRPQSPEDLKGKPNAQKPQSLAVPVAKK